MSKSRSLAKISDKRLQPLLLWEIIDWKLGFSTLLQVKRGGRAWHRAPPSSCAYDRFFEDHHVRFLSKIKWKEKKWSSRPQMSAFPPQSQVKSKKSRGPNAPPESMNSWKTLGILKKTQGICLPPKKTHLRHCLYPPLAISYRNHQKSLAYFSHLAPLILLFLSKGKVKRWGGMAQCPP